MVRMQMAAPSSLWCNTPWNGGDHYCKRFMGCAEWMGQRWAIFYIWVCIYELYLPLSGHYWRNALCFPRRWDAHIMNMACLGNTCVNNSQTNVRWCLDQSWKKAGFHHNSMQMAHWCCMYSIHITFKYWALVIKYCVIILGYPFISLHN